MSFSICIGSFRGIHIYIAATGIYLYLGWLAIILCSHDLEDAIVEASKTITYLTSENMVLKSVIQKEIPDMFNKIYPPNQPLIMKE